MNYQRRTGTGRRHGRSRRTRAPQGSALGRLVRGFFEFVLIVVLIFFAASFLGLLDWHRGGGRGAEDPWVPRQTEILPAVITELARPASEIASGEMREEADAEEPEQAPQSPRDGAALKVYIANGCGVNRLAARARDLFREAGFDVRDVTNADAADYAETIVVDRTGYRIPGQEVLDFLQQHWGVGRLVLQAREGEPVDVLVVLGTDFARSLEGEPAGRREGH